MHLARRAYRAILVIGAIALLLAGGLALDVWRYAGVIADTPADAALVLGAAVLGDEPSPVLVERLRHAQQLFETGQVRAIVVTGGRSPEDELSEAEASRDWLIAQGVPADAIVLENASRTTIENLELAKPILDAHQFGTVLVVSDPLHMRRAMLIADRLGISAASSPTQTSRFQSWGTTLPFLGRETWFMAQYLVTGR
jgi:uncharacterized SAM-binding protein YcdF (DUF218 family)